MTNKKIKVPTLVIDLDGTLCSQKSTGTYHLAEPLDSMIQRVNTLWTAGWKIVIFTARGMDTCNGDVQQVEMIYRQMTEKWLKDNRVCYTELIFGKPSGDMYVDDKGLSMEYFATWSPEQLEVWIKE